MIKRAISIRQPWVEQILRGLKRKEYRDVPTNIRERVYLYASLKQDGQPRDWRRVNKVLGNCPSGRLWVQWRLSAVAGTTNVDASSTIWFGPNG